MLYAETDQIHEYSGHVNDPVLSSKLNTFYREVVKIQADGDELEKCCELLGRELPPLRVYTFLGANAQEIAYNWV